jgi:hypothetical protein
MSAEVDFFLIGEPPSGGGYISVGQAVQGMKLTYGFDFVFGF